MVRAGAGPTYDGVVEGSPGAHRTAAVTGATGFVGRAVVRELREHGWHVRALVRDEGKARRVLPGTVELVRGDVLDDGTLDRLVSGCDAVVHLVGIIREGPGGQTFEKMHHEATRRVVAAGERASRDAPIRHLQMSALGVRDGAETAYQRTKRAGEKAVEASRLRWTVFRPSMIHGPDGEFTRLAAAWVRGQAAPFLFVPYFSPGWAPGRAGAPVAPVFVEDVARAFRAALERPAAEGRVYELAGPETLAFDDMMRVFQKLVPGARRLPVVGLPAGVAACQARALGVLGLGWLLPFDEGMARMAAEPSVSASGPARADLGFEPRGFRETLRDYAAQL